MALRTIRTGATAIPENNVLQYITDKVWKSGVVGSLSTQFQVLAGSGLSVNINAGRAYLLASGGNCYPIINDAMITNQALTSNSSGNPRIDAVVLYVDLGASANSDASNVAKIMIVAGTPASSPSAPNSSAIQSAVGASNPYIELSTVLVPSGASVPSTITDMRSEAIFAPMQHPYKWEMTLSGAQSIPNNTDTNIQFHPGNDPAGMWNDSTQVLTIPISGYYELNLQVNWAGLNTTGERQAFLSYNGSLGTVICFAMCPALPYDCSANACRVAHLNAGDTLTPIATQSSGSSLQLQVNPSYQGCIFSGHLLSID